MAERILLTMMMALAFSIPTHAVNSITLLPTKEQVVKKKTTTEVHFSLPELPKEQQVRLSVDVRVNYSSWCANNPAMTMSVNGKNVVGDNLINKPLDYHCKNGRVAYWATPQGSSWLLFSWPDFNVEDVKAFKNPYAITETDPFHYVWDITACAKTGDNVVRITHNEITSEDHFLVLRDLCVEVGPPIESRNKSGVVEPAPVGTLPTFVPRGRQRVAMTIDLSRGGALCLKVGKYTFFVTSRTSEPDGHWAVTSMDQLRAVPSGKEGTTEWSCKGYRVLRKITVRDDHVHIADTFTNTSKDLIGVMYENQLVLSDAPLEIKLAGRPSFADYQQEGGGTNPTAMARWKDIAIGLVAEDDIFRTHAKEFARSDGMGLADHELGLEPGQSHTVEWSIYPVPNGNYWDFINTVRRNWGANFTIPGMHAFVDWSNGSQSDEYYRNWVKSRQVAMVTPYDTMYDEGKAAMGTAIPLAKKFCERTATWIKQLHSVASEVKALFYINCSLCTEPGAPQKYADSKMMDWNGTQFTMAAGGAAGVTMAPLFVSTLDNSYGQAMMNVVKYIISDLKADGLYHDVLCGSPDYGGRAYGITWDGCTVNIDPKTHAVLGKTSSVALLQRSWHTALVKYLRENGKIIFGNCPIETRTHLNLKIPVFTETGFTYYSVYDTHLGSPWGYGNQPTVNPNRDLYYNTAYNLRKMLDYGAVLALPSWTEEPKELTFLHLMYPITPLELREGMVIGEERIITNRSGCYGWQDGKSGTVYVIDGDGRIVKKPLCKEISNKGHWLVEIRMPSDHFAIIVKKG